VGPGEIITDLNAEIKAKKVDQVSNDRSDEAKQM
jgi:hypothetical protein